MIDIHSQCYAYVVGGLAAQESHDFEGHLSDCPECTKEVAEMRDLTARLSESVAATPPPGLRASILTAVAETRQDLPLAREVQLPSQRELASETSNVIPIRRSWASRGSALVAAAAVLGAVGLGGWALQARDAARDDAQIATERADQLKDQADQFTQVLAAGDLQVAPGSFTPGGEGNVLRSRSEQVAMLVTSGLPSLPEGQVYEAWTFAGHAIPAGTFSSDGGRTTLLLPEAALDTHSVAVTIEPEGGSDTPTAAPIFSAAFADA